MVAVNKSLGRVEEIKRAMIKNRGKRDHKPISSHVVTLTFFPPFLFHFWCFKRIKILSQFRTTINQHFHASSSSNWYYCYCCLSAHNLRSIQLSLNSPQKVLAPQPRVHFRQVQCSGQFSPRWLLLFQCCLEVWFEAAGGLCLTR